MPHPPLEVFQNAIRTMHKRVGLRKLYRDYHVKDPVKRAAYRVLWDEVAKRMPDEVYQPKEVVPAPPPERGIEILVERARLRDKNYARKKRKTKTTVCYCPPPAGFVVQEEQSRAENEQSQAS